MLKFRISRFLKSTEPLAGVFFNKQNLFITTSLLKLFFKAQTSQSNSQQYRTYQSLDVASLRFFTKTKRSRLQNKSFLKYKNFKKYLKKKFIFNDSSKAKFLLNYDFLLEKKILFIRKQGYIKCKQSLFPKPVIQKKILHINTTINSLLPIQQLNYFQTHIFGVFLNQTKVFINQRQSKIECVSLYPIKNPLNSYRTNLNYVQYILNYARLKHSNRSLYWNKLAYYSKQQFIFKQVNKHYHTLFLHSLRS